MEDEQKQQAPLEGQSPGENEQKKQKGAEEQARAQTYASALYVELLRAPCGHWERRSFHAPDGTARRCSLGAESLDL